MGPLCRRTMSLFVSCARWLEWKCWYDQSWFSFYVKRPTSSPLIGNLVNPRQQKFIALRILNSMKSFNAIVKFPFFLFTFVCCVCVCVVILVNSWINSLSVGSSARSLQGESLVKLEGWMVAATKPQILIYWFSKATNSIVNYNFTSAVHEHKDSHSRWVGKYWSIE